MEGNRRVRSALRVFERFVRIKGNARIQASIKDGQITDNTRSKWVYYPFTSISLCIPTYTPSNATKTIPLTTHPLSNSPVQFLPATSPFPVHHLLRNSLSIGTIKIMIFPALVVQPGAPELATQICSKCISPVVRNSHVVT